MVQGTFFKVDTDSLLSEGQVLFRYLPVYRGKIDESKKYHHFPVYVVFKPFAIDFYYHGPDIYKRNTGEAIHVHACILHLPLSLNLAVKDNLSARLSAMFYNGFPIGEEYKYELSDLRTAYWNLEVFHGNRGGFKEESIYKSDSTTGKQIVLRKLILDFIFDMEHSKVFEASPYYEEVEVHLCENYFFNAIAAKAAYYYNRKLYLDNLANDSGRDLYVHTLADAELQWLNILRDAKATEAFWHEDWFNKVEEEYKAVLFDESFKRSVWRAQLDARGRNKNLQKNENEYEEKNIRILKESARWFLRRYDLLNGIRTIFQFYYSRILYILLLAILTFFVMPVYLYQHNSSVLNNGGLIFHDHFFAILLYFFLGMVPFIVIVFFLLHKMILPLIGVLLPRLLMAVASSWLYFSTTEELIKSSFDIKMFDGNHVWVLLLLIPVILFVIIEIRNMAPDIDKYELSKRLLTLLIMGFVYSLLIGMFFTNSLTRTILVRTGYLKNFYEGEIKNNNEDGFKLQIGGFNNDKLNFFPCDRKLPNTEIGFFSELNDYSEECKYEYLKYVTYEACWLTKIRFRLLYKIPINKEYFSFDLFPGMLIYRSFFVLFVGIFIQLVFEDKPISEPL